VVTGFVIAPGDYLYRLEPRLFGSALLAADGVSVPPDLPAHVARGEVTDLKVLLITVRGAR
jgi:hypothetical protein